MEDKISKLINKAIKEKVFPGCTIGYIKDGKKKVLAFGNHTYDQESPKINKDSVYDIASITKTIPNSMILLKLIDDGVVDINDPVYKFIPEFANYKNKKEVKLFHLLTYTLDMELPSMSSMKNLSAEEIIDKILNAKLKYEAGENHVYVGATSLVTTIVIERILNKNLEEISKEIFFKNMEMERSTFYPLERIPLDEIVPTEMDDWRGGLIHGEVHDESSFILGKEKPVGIAGLFSTSSDLLNFSEMILNNGKYKNQQILSEEIIGKMTINQNKNKEDAFGLGWEMKDLDFMGDYRSERTIAKRGYTGCSILIDVKNKISIILLSNRVYPKRPVNGEKINEVRRNLSNIIFSE